MNGALNTVLGLIDKLKVKACLCHEHICCYSEYLFKTAGKEYLDKETAYEIIRKNPIKMLSRCFKILENNEVTQEWK